MKNLIRQILNETIDTKLIKILSNKFDISDFYNILYFVQEIIGITEDEFLKIFNDWFELESGLKLTPTNWMDYNFGPDKTKVIESPLYPNRIYYKTNDGIVMEYNTIDNIFYFETRKITSFLGDYLKMSKSDVKIFLSEWLKKNYNINNTSIGSKTSSIYIPWKEL